MCLAIKKIGTYNLRYRNEVGELHPVYLRTYIWKAVTGLMFDFVKKRREIYFSDLADSNIEKYE